MQAAQGGRVLVTIAARGSERSLAGPAALSLGVMVKQTVCWEGMHAVHTGFSYDVEEGASPFRYSWIQGSHLIRGPALLMAHSSSCQFH